MEQLTGKMALDDDAKMSWLLTRLSIAKAMGDEATRGRLSEQLTAPEICRRLTGEDAVVAQRLLEELEPEGVRLIAGELVRKWALLSPAVAAAALVRLGECAPAAALPLLEREAQRPGELPEPLMLSALSRTAMAIGAAARPALEGLILRCCGGGDLVYWNGLLVAAVALELPQAAELVARTIAGTGMPELEGAWILEEIYQALVPGMPFLSMLHDIEFQRRGYRFADLPELFEPECEIARLDKLAESSGGRGLSGALELLGGDEGRPASYARRLARALPAGCEGGVRRLVALFVLAVAAAQRAAGGESVAGMAIQQLLDVLGADLERLHLESAIIAELVARVDEGRVALLYDELVKARSYRGAGRLVRLVQRLGRPDSVAPLIACLDEEADEDGAWAAAMALAGQGDLAVTELSRCWPELDEGQRCRALEVLGAVASEAAVAELARRYEEAARSSMLLSCWRLAVEASGSRELWLLDRTGARPGDEDCGPVRAVVVQ